MRHRRISALIVLALLTLCYCAGQETRNQHESPDKPDAMPPAQAVTSPPPGRQALLEPYSKAIDKHEYARQQAHLSGDYKAEAIAAFSEAQLWELFGDQESLSKAEAAYRASTAAARVANDIGQQSLAANNLGVLLLKEGRTSDALTVFRDIDVLSVTKTERSAFLFNIGRATELIGDLASAHSKYLESVASDPMFLPALNGAFRTIVAQKASAISDAVTLTNRAILVQQPDVAYSVVPELLTAWGSNPDAHHLLAALLRVYVAKGITPKAFENHELTTLKAIGNQYPALKPRIEEMQKIYTAKLSLVLAEASTPFASWYNSSNYDPYDSTALVEAFDLLARFYSDEDQTEMALGRYGAAWDITHETRYAAEYASLLSQHADLDPEGKLIDELITTLSVAKASENDEKERADILRLHVALASGLEERRKCGNVHDPKSGAFQWKYAIELDAKDRYEDPSLPPSPGLHEHLGDCYYETGQMSLAGKEWYSAALGYRELGNLDKASDLLVSMNGSVPFAESDKDLLAAVRQAIKQIEYERRVGYSGFIQNISIRRVPISGSVTYGQISFTVVDSTGAAVSNANVEVKSQEAGAVKTGRTGLNGANQFLFLSPGNYEVTVDALGFESKHFSLHLDSEDAQIKVPLKVATPSISVEVTGIAPLIDTTTATVGQYIDQRTIQDIPLNGRHFVDLGLLIPGTVTPPQNGFLTAPLRGQGSFTFNTAGNREDAINFMINGINLNDMVQNQVTFQPTINTVSQFKIDNSTYSAEYGQNAGSLVNIATRSGNNQFHGEVYEYVRNNYFDARNAFDRRFSATGEPILMPDFKRNQFGADLGGPIVYNKTFFFLSYEGLRKRQGLSLASHVFPDSGAGVTRASIQAAGNPTANALLGLIPHANGTLGGGAAFFGSALAPVDVDQGTADIKHNISIDDHLHGYYVYQHDLTKESTAGTSIPGFGDTREGKRQILTLGETHVFRANVVNDARLGANRIHITFFPNNLTSPGSLGLTSALGPNEIFMPTIVISPLNLTFGNERGFSQTRGDTTFVIADTLSWVRSKHSFKFGGEWRDFRNNNFNGDPGALTYLSLSNFQNDTVDLANRTVGNVANRIDEAALDFFAIDSWKSTSNLTWEFGLRYAWNMTPSEALNRFVTLVPGVGTGSTLVTVGQPYAQNNRNFQPRVGFAWNLFRNGNTMLRGGYAFQVDEPIVGFITGLSSNPPFALPIAVQAPSSAGLAISALGPNFVPGPVVKNLAPTLIDPNFKNADVQSWNLNIQQQVTRSTGLMIGYFGSKGTHLEIEKNINQFLTLGNSATRPFHSLSMSSPILPTTTTLNTNTLANSITGRFSDANSEYNALWVTANQRVSHGLQFNASYTLSHSIDEASRNNNGIVVQDSTNIAGSRGPSDFDVRHRFVVSAIYDLPFKGNLFVTGWKIGSILSFQSGSPFNIVLATNSITGEGNTIRPNVSDVIHVTGEPAQWIRNLSTLADPGPVSFGNLGRNAVVGPGFRNIDLSLSKNTKLTERCELEFHVDALNLENHPNFGQPYGVLSFPIAASFGTVTSTRVLTGESGSSRQLQFAMRLEF